MSSRFKTGFGLAALGLAALAPAAHAGTRLYSPQACQLVSPGFNQAFVDPQEFENPPFSGQDPLQVGCLIERTNLTNTNGLSNFQAKIRIGALPLTRPLVCDVEIVDSNGNFVKDVQKFTETASKDFQIFNWNWGTSVNTSKSGGVFGFTCNLPIGAAILNYRATEY
jgi:hypothetical protein